MRLFLACARWVVSSVAALVGVFAHVGLLSVGIKEQLRMDYDWRRHAKYTTILCGFHRAIIVVSLLWSTMYFSVDTVSFICPWLYFKK